MKKILLLFLALNTSFLLHAQDTTQVLFIGNSITYFNNMPQTFEAIANSKGDTTAVTMYAPGGTGFIHHVNDQNVYDLFKQGNWDYVVLQPGSNESPGYTEPINQTLIRARKLKDSIRFYNPCAKIVYYEISYGVWGNTPSDVNSYNTTMGLIRSNLEYLSDSTASFFAPAGEAIRTAWNNDLNTMLWGGTGDIHPNDKGSYIIACSFYAGIFQKPSYGTSIISSLSPIEASNYQQLADTTVLNNLSDWRINTYNQFTDYNYLIGQGGVSFTSTSQNIDSLRWDFGDGNTSNQPSLTHNYNQSGSYMVTLTTYKGGCADQITKNINVVVALSLNSFNKTKPNIFPNPCSEKIIIHDFDEEEISICNILGQLCNKDISTIRTTKGLEVNISKLPKGVYIVRTNSFVSKIYKQ